MLFELENINTGYHPEQTILEDLTFSIEEGEFIGIIGPNGSGKSTLLRTLGKLLPLHSGTLYFKGRLLKDWKRKELAKEIALVEQELPLVFGYTIEQLVLMGRFPYLKAWQTESEKDYEIIEEAMKLTSIWDLRKHLYNELSGGERQRVMLARALAQDTKILFLDEPTAHLDLNHQIELLDLVSQLNKTQKHTILFISHDLNLASNYCSKLILLYKGKLHKIGTPEEILSKECLEKIYNIKLEILEHPTTGKPLVIPSMRC